MLAQRLRLESLTQASLVGRGWSLLLVAHTVFFGLEECKAAFCAKELGSKKRHKTKLQDSLFRYCLFLYSPEWKVFPNCLACCQWNEAAIFFCIIEHPSDGFFW